MVALKIALPVIGFNLMTQSTGENGSSPNRLRHHGILGYYSGSNNPDEIGEHIAPMRNALNTQLPIVADSAPGVAVATTGSSHTLSGGGFIIVAGRPYFRDAELSNAARTEGVAAVLAGIYPKHGQEVFSLLYGSYSCAIVDTQANRALLGVDRLGQHSLYYSMTDGTLYFGSLASVALAGVGGESTLLNQGIYNYLYFHMVPSPGSVYRGLNKLPAAHYLDFQDGQCRTVNYWLPNFSESRRAQSIDEFAKQLKDTLKTAVKRSLVDAGNVGSFLSGGLDSSTVTGVLAEVSERQAQAYSIGFSAEGYDEMAFARITAGHFDAALTEYYVTPEDVVDALPLIATSYDEPFGNSSALPAYFCAKVAAENGITTLLAGDGGDEIFAGNERYVRQRVFEHYARIPRALRRGLLEPIVAALPLRLPLAAKAKSYISQANMPLPDRLQSYNFLHRHAASEIFSADFLSEVDMQLPMELQRSIYHRPGECTDLNRMLYLDWQITLADNDLRKVSHMCALAGVDVVYPMLDDALVELACQVPSSWKIKGGDLRHFYKQALSDWLPQETINKSKQGFGLPFGVWMQTYQPLREMAYDNLLRLKKRDFIRPEFIDQTIEMHQSEHAAYYGELVWLFTVFELWMEGHSSSGTQEKSGSRPTVIDSLP